LRASTSRRAFRVVLIKPSHYDADGYVIQWWRSTLPSNSLASVYGLVEECARARTLGLDVAVFEIRRAEDIMEQDPPLVPVAWENILDAWYNYVKGHNPKDYFGIYDVVRFDTFWLDKA